MRYKLIYLLLITLLFSLSGCTNLAGKTVQDKTISNAPLIYKISSSSKSNAYTFFNADDLDGWDLEYMTKDFSELRFDTAKALAKQGVVDVAHWKLNRGNDTIYLWIKIFENNDKLHRAKSDILVFYKWEDSAKVLVGDEALLGIYSSDGQKPLLMFAYTKDNMLVHVVFENSEGEYDISKANSEDRPLLVKIGKQVLEGYESSLSSPS